MVPSLEETANRLSPVSYTHLDFPENEKPNLIFFGPPGLGKTFVADCIAQRVMERAYLVRRVTAYRLCEIMRKNQFDGSEGDVYKRQT